MTNPQKRPAYKPKTVEDTDDKAIMQARLNLCAAAAKRGYDVVEYGDMIWEDDIARVREAIEMMGAFFPEEAHIFVKPETTRPRTNPKTCQSYQKHNQCEDCERCTCMVPDRPGEARHYPSGKIVVTRQKNDQVFLCQGCRAYRKYAGER